jgi:multidrug efflux pump subunit AcrA (membrane-fusion protein)
VRVQSVRTGDVVQGQTHLATVVPAQTVRILAQVPGTVAQLGPDTGEPLEHNGLVARILAPDVAARGARVGAEAKRAQQERDFVCTQLETDRVLAAAGDLPAVALSRSETGCASAGLAVEAAKAAEREVLVMGTRSREKAPFDGQVLEYLVDTGQTVMPGMPLALFGSAEQHLRLRLVAQDLKGVRVGSRVVTELGGGKVVEIGAQAQGPGRLYPVEVALDSPAGLRVGATINATVVLEEVSNASAVPDGALGQDQDGDYVLVEDSQMLRRVDVELGPRQDGWVAVTPTLPPGTRVATGAVQSFDVERPVLAVMP